MKTNHAKNLCRTALIAAVYFGLSVIFSALSFGQIQVRVSEALTILPCLSPLGIPGVTVGCLISNIYGAFTGSNILGVMDIFIGPAATFVSALLTRLLRGFKFKGLPFPATIPPVIINAFVIGAEFSYITTGKILSPVFWIFSLQVGAGQIISCTVLGLILYKGLTKRNITI